MNPGSSPNPDRAKPVILSLEPGPTVAARLAQPAWAATALRLRLQVLRQLRWLLAEQCAELAQTVAAIRGCSVAEALVSEVLPLLDAIRFLEQRAQKILAPQRVGVAGWAIWLAGVRSVIHREPLGVVLIVAPANYPLFLAGVQVVQALAAGNAVVLKPGVGGTPAATAFATALALAGLPPRVFTVLPEPAATVTAAIAAGVDKVFLTGAAATGRKVLHALADQLVPATMELSGCDAVVVRADADLDLTVRALAFGLRLNRGATCIAPRRVLVPAGLASELESRLLQAIQEIPQCEITGVAADQVRVLIREALAVGARMVAGAVAAQISGPLVLASVPTTSNLLRADLFAPVLALVPVTDDAAAVRLVNDCPYALGATIFSRDVPRARQLAAQLHVGGVVINDLIVPTADARLPFGGRRHSGFGVTRGAEGLREMTVPKVVTVRGGRWRPHFSAPRPADAARFQNFIQLAHGGSWRQRWRALCGLISRRQSL
ncbi:MAG TPA: aldehyde dehydrogenase family protein [Dongiaceae bacterium]|jgi:acyl-CoA reductase-like NAD-dependent aldehyde dehydrogenase|nr:aldehyde dehydrogenase family protein [Dongiaceae bacterium]